MAGQVKVYTLHLWPPLEHGRQAPTQHYTGSSLASRLKIRLTDHALGRSAVRLLEVQLERGGRWVVAQVEPGSRMREIQLKQRGASRRCEVCKAVKGFQSGQLSKEEALARAGWEHASQADRSTLLEIFGLEPEAAPCMAPHVEPFVPAPRPEPVTEIAPEINDLVDALIEGWSPKDPEPSAAPDGELCTAPEQEIEMEAG